MEDGSFKDGGHGRPHRGVALRTVLKEGLRGGSHGVSLEGCPGVDSLGMGGVQLWAVCGGVSRRGPQVCFTRPLKHVHTLRCRRYRRHLHTSPRP